MFRAACKIAKPKKSPPVDSRESTDFATSLAGNSAELLKYFGSAEFINYAPSIKKEWRAAMKATPLLLLATLSALIVFMRGLSRNVQCCLFVAKTIILIEPRIAVARSMMKLGDRSLLLSA
jgi:hypothetical protein